MKPNLYHICFSFLAFFLTQSVAFAQDAPDYNHPNSYDRDTSAYTYSDSEAKSGTAVKTNASTTARDSAAIRAVSAHARPARSD